MTAQALKPILRWRQRLGFEEKPYLVRWVAAWNKFSVRLHHWLGSDDHRHAHDHSWWFLTIVLWGGYTDSTPIYDAAGKQAAWETDRLRAGSIRLRRADHRHYVKLEPGKTAWTLLFTGPHLRTFGFWLNRDKRINSKRYFFRFGHHAPKPGEAPRRTVKVREGLSLPGGTKKAA